MLNNIISLNLFLNIILVVIIVLIIALAVLYIIKAKKNGQKCIGCPSSKSCSNVSIKENIKSCCCECKEEKESAIK